MLPLIGTFDVIAVAALISTLKGWVNCTLITPCPGCRQSALTDADQGVRVTFSIDERLRQLDLAADDLEFRGK